MTAVLKMRDLKTNTKDKRPPFLKRRPVMERLWKENKCLRNHYWRRGFLSQGQDLQRRTDLHFRDPFLETLPSEDTVYIRDQYQQWST